MITLTEHLKDHVADIEPGDDGIGIIPSAGCSCGWAMRLGDEDDHAAHVSATWQEARTVRTVDALDALPGDALILSHGDSSATDAFDALDSIEQWPDDVDDILPAVVLWVPEDGAAHAEAGAGRG